MGTTVEGGTGHCKVHAGSHAKLDVSSSACTSLCTGGVLAPWEMAMLAGVEGTMPGKWSEGSF